MFRYKSKEHQRDYWAVFDRRNSTMCHRNCSLFCIMLYQVLLGCIFPASHILATFAVKRIAVAWMDVLRLSSIPTNRPSSFPLLDSGQKGNFFAAVSLIIHSSSEGRYKIEDTEKIGCQWLTTKVSGQNSRNIQVTPKQAEYNHRDTVCLNAGR